jgi:hypothetical protein
MTGLLKLQNDIIKIIEEARKERIIKKREKVMKVVNLFKTIWNWLEGKKSYLTATTIAILSLLQASGVPIPLWIYITLTAIFGAAIRSAITRV